MFKKDRIKTTISGLLSVALGVKFAVSGQWDAAIAAISTGVGLIVAKDAE